MLVAVLLLVFGAVVLIAGAEAAIRGASAFALAAGISAFVLGALLFGIDIEGLSAAVLAAARGQTEIAGGEAFGTVVFLFGVGFAIAVLLSREPVPSPSVLMVIAPSLPVAAAALSVYDRYVTRFEGVLLVLLYVAYVWAVVAEGRAVQRRAQEVEEEAREVRGGASRALVLTIIGLVAVYGGAWLLVDGGVRVLARTGLTAGFVGAAIVGALASLDEVLLETLPLVRGRPELATGNLFGTAAAFPSVVLGIAALVRPLVLDASATLAFLVGAFMYTLVASAFLVRGRAGKLTALVLVGAYVAWLGYAATL